MLGLTKKGRAGPRSGEIISAFSSQAILQVVKQQLLC